MALHTKHWHHTHNKKQHNKKVHDWKNFIDRSIYVMGVVGPIMTIPQLSKIWIEKNASGVSVISWSTYLVTAFVWLAYGIEYKKKPIIFTYTLWIIIEIFIVIGALLYG
jgi:uncharacterized protein with PQ loop repeat